MSAVAKTLLIEIQIKDGKKKKTYFVAPEVAMTVTHLLQVLEANKSDSIPAEEVFPDLKDPIKRPAIAFRGMRARLGLTQADMGKKLGLHQTDVSKIEKGERPIGKKLAMRIGKALGVDYKRFL